MEARLLVAYDRIGDILYLETVSPYPEQSIGKIKPLFTRAGPQAQTCCTGAANVWDGCHPLAHAEALQC